MDRCSGERRDVIFQDAACASGFDVSGAKVVFEGDWYAAERVVLAGVDFGLGLISLGKGLIRVDGKESVVVRVFLDDSIEEGLGDFASGNLFGAEFGGDFSGGELVEQWRILGLDGLFFDDGGNDEEAGFGIGGVAEGFFAGEGLMGDISSKDVLHCDGVGFWSDAAHIEVLDIFEVSEEGVELALEAQEFGFGELESGEIGDVAHLVERN